MSSSTDSTTGRLRLTHLVVALSGLLLLAFVVVEVIGPAWLTDPARWQDSGSTVVAAASVALLALDVLLPVPSSVVMVANGTLFGLVGGGLVSAAGLLASSLLAYSMGRWAGDRFGARLRHDEVTRLRLLLHRHGAVFIVATRSVPIVAELAGLLAGAGPMAFGRYFYASALGATAVGFSYALIGTWLDDSNSVPVVFGVGAAVTAVMWWWSRRLLKGE